MRFKPARIALTIISRAISALAVSSFLPRLRSNIFFGDEAKTGWSASNWIANRTNRVATIRGATTSMQTCCASNDRPKRTRIVAAAWARNPLRMIRNAPAASWRRARRKSHLALPQNGTTFDANAPRQRRSTLTGVENGFGRARPVGQRPSFAFRISFTACGLALPPDDFIT